MVCNFSQQTHGTDGGIDFIHLLIAISSDNETIVHVLNIFTFLCFYFNVVFYTTKWLIG
ncbi:hypothetical protein ACE6H2_015294 [Prunus campanulata]